MRELGGLSYDEIATALDTTALAARQAVFAAKRKLDSRGRALLAQALELRLLPAPAGFALLGLFGGGGAAAAPGKTLIGTAAAVSRRGRLRRGRRAGQGQAGPRGRAIAAATPVPKVKTTTKATAKRLRRSTAATATPAATVTAVVTAAPKVRVRRVAAMVTRSRP